MIDYYWERNGTVPGTYTMDLAGRLLEIGREEGLQASEVEHLDNSHVAREAEVEGPDRKK